MMYLITCVPNERSQCRNNNPLLFFLRGTVLKYGLEDQVTYGNLGVGISVFVVNYIDK